MTWHFGRGAAAGVTRILLSVGICWLLRGKVYAGPTPLEYPKGWEHYFDYSSFKEDVSGEAFIATADLVHPDTCLPECTGEKEYLPDRSSCNHFFICAKNTTEGESTHIESSILMRCACPGKNDVYNRYLQRCSRSGQCRQSCDSPKEIFKNWISTSYNGYECIIPPQTLIFLTQTQDVPHQQSSLFRANSDIQKPITLQDHSRQTQTVSPSQQTEDLVTSVAELARPQEIEASVSPFTQTNSFVVSGVSNSQVSQASLSGSVNTHSSLSALDQIPISVTDTKSGPLFPRSGIDDLDNHKFFFPATIPIPAIGIQKQTSVITQTVVKPLVVPTVIGVALPTIPKPSFPIISKPILPTIPKPTIPIFPKPILPVIPKPVFPVIPKPILPVIPKPILPIIPIGISKPSITTPIQKPNIISSILTKPSLFPTITKPSIFPIFPKPNISGIFPIITIQKPFLKLDIDESDLLPESIEDLELIAEDPLMPTLLEDMTQEPIPPETIQEPVIHPEIIPLASNQSALTQQPATLPATVQQPEILPATIYQPAILPETIQNTVNSTNQKPELLPETIYTQTTLPFTTQLPDTLTATSKPTSSFITSKPAIQPINSLKPASVPTAIQKPTVLPESSQKPVVLPATIPLTTMQIPSQLPTTILKPSTLPGTIQKPATLPAIIQKPATLPVTIQKPISVPATIQKPDALPETILKPATLPATIQNPAILPTTVMIPSVQASTIQNPVILPAPIEKPILPLATIQTPAISLEPSETSSSVSTDTETPHLLPDSLPILIPSTDHITMHATSSQTVAPSEILQTAIAPNVDGGETHASSVLPESSFIPVVTLPGMIETTSSTVLGVTQTASTLTATIESDHPTHIFITGVTHTSSLISSETIFSLSSTKIPLSPTTSETDITPSTSMSSSLTLQPMTTLSPTITETPISLPEMDLKPANCRPMKCKVANSRFPNPKDCSRYYKCVMIGEKLVPYPYVCPSVMPTFSPTLMMCLRGIKCLPGRPYEDSSTLEPTSNTTTRMNSTQGMLNTNLAYTDMTFPMLNLFHSDNFESVDVNGTITNQLAFNISLHNVSIDTTSNKTWVDPCELRCSTPKMKVADPKDCHYYYLCMIAEDLSPRPIRIKCPRSRPVFSLYHRECTKSVKCEVRCQSKPEINSTNAMLTQTEVSTSIAQPVPLTSSTEEISTTHKLAFTTSPAYEYSKPPTTSPSSSSITLNTIENITTLEPYLTSDTSYSDLANYSVPVQFTNIYDTDDVGTPIPSFSVTPSQTELLDKNSTSLFINFSNTENIAVTTENHNDFMMNISNNTDETTAVQHSDNVYTTAISLTTTNPSECNPVCLVPDSWLPDPTDCHYFYVCHFLNDVLSKPRRIACPPNRPIFSRQEGRCLAEGPCVVTCKEPVSISSSSISITDCKHKCIVPYSVVPDPTDCSHYYICIFVHSLTLESLRAKCPRSNPYFDPVSKKCVKEGKCNIRCTQHGNNPVYTTENPISTTADYLHKCRPQCKSPNTLVHDPITCDHYYICTLTESGLLKPIKMKCPGSLKIFDKSISSCTLGNQCKTDCHEMDMSMSQIDENSSSSILESILGISTTTVFIATNATTDDQMTATMNLNDSKETHDMTNNSSSMTMIETSSGTSTCQPKCNVHNTVTNDPRDCHYYYVCMIVEGIPYVTRVQCPPDRPIFHLQSQACQQNIPCTKTCENVVTSQPEYETTIVNQSSTEGNTENTTIEQSIHTTAQELNNLSSSYTNFGITNSTMESLVETQDPFSQFPGPTTVSVMMMEDNDHLLGNSSTSSMGMINSTEIYSQTMDLTTASFNPPLVTPSSLTGSTSADIDTTVHIPVECTPKCKKQGTILPDLTDCHYYYVCILINSLIPQPVRNKCPVSSPIFDSSKNQCITNGTCLNLCPSSLVDEIAFPEDISPPIAQTDESALCPPLCEIPNSVIPDPNDCHYYFYCSLVKGILTARRNKCPEEIPIFDKMYLTCNKDVPCTTSCKDIALFRPSAGMIAADNYCPHAGYFALSRKCISSYDHCYNRGQAIIRMKRECPKGLVFNTISTYPYCVPPEDCPYDPKIQGSTANATSCRHPGHFPRCKHCCSDFISCEITSRGEYKPISGQCSGGLVFNTDPTYPVCLEKSDCPTGGISVRECEVQGNYPACSKCCRNYFHCTHDGRLQRRTCPYPLVFNGHPSYQYCVLAWNCPYVIPQ